MYRKKERKSQIENLFSNFHFYYLKASLNGSKGFSWQNWDSWFFLNLPHFGPNWLKPTFLIIKYRDQKKKEKLKVFRIFFQCKKFYKPFDFVFLFSFCSIDNYPGLWSKKKSWSLKCFWAFFEGKPIISDKQKWNTVSEIHTQGFFVY